MFLFYHFVFYTPYSILCRQKSKNKTIIKSKKKNIVSIYKEILKFIAGKSHKTYKKKSEPRKPTWCYFSILAAKKEIRIWCCAAAGRYGHGFGEPQHHSHTAFFFFFFVFFSKTFFFLHRSVSPSHSPSSLSEAPRSYGSRRGEDDSPFPSRFPHRMVSLIKFILSLFFVILLSVSAANLDSDSPSPCYVYCLITSILCWRIIDLLLLHFLASN